MANSRTETFIGFAIKSGKIALGSGAISTLRGGVYLIILDATAAKNSKRLALKFKNRFSCPLLLCKQDFERVVNREDCKIAAIKDPSLAKAILDGNEPNYELYAGGSL